MKTIKQIFTLLFVFAAIISCNEDFMEETDFGIVAPSEVGAAFQITQDNTGLVTITPTAVNAISFDIDFGDGSAVATGVVAGKNVKHTFTEATHTLKVTAKGLNNLKTTADVQLVVSFKAPENLVVAITNDESVSKQVNVVATADYATTFDFLPGEADAVAVSANIGETASFVYKAAGTYAVKVTAKGGAIATTDYSVDFEVTALLQPTTSAPTSKDRPSSSVVSIFSDKYTDVANVDLYPNWGQSTQYTAYDLNGDKMIQYSNLNYQGIQFDEQDVSGMEFLHMDMWTADLDAIDIFPISKASGEKSVNKTLTKDAWNSFDIAISDFTDQGLSMNDIFQFKFVGAGNKSVFIDNIYFYKKSEIKLPIKFDKEEKFKGDGGAGFELSKDPDNSANNTGKVTNSGSDWENVQINLDQPIKVVKDGLNKYSVKIYSPDSNEHKLSMKLEESGENEYIILAQTFSTKGWNTLNFDFSTVTEQDYPNGGAAFDGTADFKKLVFFIDGGSSTAGTYHIDDIVKVVAAGDQVIFDDFEGNGTISWRADALGKSIVANPLSSGNSSANVLKYDDTGGQYANIQFDADQKFDLSTNNKFTFKIYIPADGITGSQPNQVEVKLQDGSKERPWEGQFGVTTPLVLDKWQTVMVDFSSKASSTEFSRIVFQVNSENNNDKVVAYIDDFEYVTPVTHDDFEGNGNISTWYGDACGQEIIDNPVSGTINNSAKVLKYSDDGGQYANIRFDAPQKLDLSIYNKVTVKVYVPSSGLTGSQDNKLWIKLQDGSSGEPWVGQAQKEQAITLDKWQTLEFDFSDQKSETKYSRILLQFNGENNTDKVLAYVDNIFVHR
jgi:hypothetical protein